MTELDIGGRTARTSRCEGCDGEILWVLTVHGKLQPVDAVPDPNGNVVLTGEWGVGPRGAAPTSRVVQPAVGLFEGADEAGDDEIERHMPHHATCPEVGRFRKPKGRT